MTAEEWIILKESRNKACRLVRVLRKEFNKARHAAYEAGRYEETRKDVPKLKKRRDRVELKLAAARSAVEEARLSIAQEHK